MTGRAGVRRRHPRDTDEPPTSEEKTSMTTTDSKTSTGTVLGVVADPDRVQHLDPRTLVMDPATNIREAKPSREFTASVHDHGVLQPIRAVATEDGRARVRFGHRRTLAAIAAGLDTVPVIVHPTDGYVDEDTTRLAEIERVSTQYAENTHREGLSAGEQLDTFAALADLGLTAGQIAGKTKARRRDVAAALRAAAVPEARDAVQAAALTLDQGATLAEFAEEPEVYEALLERATGGGRWGGSFEHLAARFRQDRIEARAMRALTDALLEQGTRVIERPSFISDATVRLCDLTDPALTDEHRAGRAGIEDVADAAVGSAGDDPEELAEDDDPGEFDEDVDVDETAYMRWSRHGGRPESSLPPEITPEAHAGCPGHAAYVVWMGRRGGEAVYVCTDPAALGHQSRVGRALDTGRSGRDQEDPTPRAGETEQEATQRAAEAEAARKERDRAERRRVITGNKAWRAATEVRRAFLAEVVARKTPPTGAGAYTARALALDSYALTSNGGKSHDLAAELLTGQDSDTAREVGRSPYGHERVTALIDGASDPRGQVITLALILAGIEVGTGPHTWRRDSYQRSESSTDRYLRFLASIGYDLAPIERAALGEDVDDSEWLDPTGTAGQG